MHLKISSVKWRPFLSGGGGGGGGGGGWVKAWKVIILYDIRYKFACKIALLLGVYTVVKHQYSDFLIKNGTEPAFTFLFYNVFSIPWS